MDTWLGMNMILMFVAGIILVVFAAFLGIEKWREWRNKDGREVRVQRSRGPSVIIGEWGPMYVTRYVAYTNSQYNVEMKDRWGRKHSVNMHAHELRPANIMQAAFGPGNPLFYHTPGTRAPIIAAQQYRQVTDAGILHEYKQTSERATREAKLAQTHINERTKEQLERLAQLEKMKQPVMATTRNR